MKQFEIDIKRMMLLTIWPMMNLQERSQSWWKWLHCDSVPKFVDGSDVLEIQAQLCGFGYHFCNEKRPKTYIIYICKNQFFISYTSTAWEDFKL